MFKGGLNYEESLGQFRGVCREIKKKVWLEQRQNENNHLYSSKHANRYPDAGVGVVSDVTIWTPTDLLDQGTIISEHQEWRPH